MHGGSNTTHIPMHERRNLSLLLCMLSSSNASRGW